MDVTITNSGPLITGFAKASVIPYTLTESSMAVSPTTTTTTDGDAVVNVNTGASGRPVKTFSFDVALSGVAIRNLNPEKFALRDYTLTAESGATGNGQIVIDHDGASRMVTLSAISTGATVSRTLNSFTEGALGDVSITKILTMLTTGGDLNYYNGSTYAECAAEIGGIQRNAGCWAADLDLSGVAVSHLYGGFWGGGALVTPRHYICSNHYEPRLKTGMMMRFVGNDGTVHTRTVLAQTSGSTVSGEIANPDHLVGDTCMFLLSGPDLPASVTPYPLTGDWIASFTLNSTGGGLGNYDIETSNVFITTNQNRNVYFCVSAGVQAGYTVPHPLPTETLAGVAFTLKPYNSFGFSRGPQLSGYSAFQSSAIVGDSGSPVFNVAADGSLSLVTVMTYPNIGTYIEEIMANAMIADVDSIASITTGLTVTVAPDPTL